MSCYYSTCFYSISLDHVILQLYWTVNVRLFSSPLSDWIFHLFSSPFSFILLAVSLLLILTGSINLAKFLFLRLSQFGIFFLVRAHQSVLHSLKGSFKSHVGLYCSGRHIPFNCILRQCGRCIKLNFLISRVCFCSWNSKIWRLSSTLIRQTSDSTCRVNVTKWMCTSGLYYHLVHMCRAVPSSFPLGQTRQGEYTSGRWRCGAPLTSEAPNAFAGPHKPTPACQNATKHE